MKSRGIRNNNPLNIRRSDQPWRGKLQYPTDPEFEQFANLEYGFRAAFVIIRTYINRHRCNTPRMIVARWAPTTENNTTAYLNYVCQKAQLDPSRRLKFTEKNAVCRLVWAMAHYECGVEFSFGRVENAYALASR